MSKKNPKRKNLDPSTLLSGTTSNNPRSSLSLVDLLSVYEKTIEELRRELSQCHLKSDSSSSSLSKASSKSKQKRSSKKSSKWDSTELISPLTMNIAPTGDFAWEFSNWDSMPSKSRSSHHHPFPEDHSRRDLKSNRDLYSRDASSSQFSQNPTVRALQQSTQSSNSPSKSKGLLKYGKGAISYENSLLDYHDEEEEEQNDFVDEEDSQGVYDDDDEYYDDYDEEGGDYDDSITSEVDDDAYSEQVSEDLNYNFQNDEEQATSPLNQSSSSLCLTSSSNINSSGNLKKSVSNFTSIADLKSQLYKAINSGNSILFPYIVDDPRAVNFQDNNTGQTTLDMVIDRESDPLLSILLESSLLDVNQADSKNRNIVHKIALMDTNPFSKFHYKALKRILKCRNETAHSQRDDEQCTPLFYAVQKSNIKIVRLLVKYHADINSGGPNETTPLALATKNLNVEIVDFLLANGANPNLVDSYGNNPLHHILKIVSNFKEYTSTRRSPMNSREPISPRNQILDSSTLNNSTSHHSTFNNTSSPFNSTTRSPSMSSSDESGHLKRSSSVDLNELPGVRPSEEVIRIIKSLLAKSTNISLPNLRGETPLAKSVFYPEIHKLFEDYNPGVKAWKHRYQHLKLESFDSGELFWKTGAKSNNLNNNSSFIGKGSFGEVFKCVIHGSVFAVKMIDLRDAPKHEAGIMMDIRHPNILTFIGVYQPPPEDFEPLDSKNHSMVSQYSQSRLGIITEYLPMGSLTTFLGADSPKVIAWPIILRVALCVARGMAWLHGRDPAILHHDLHGGNVLMVSEHGDAKVCDFGLSQVEGRAPTRQYSRISPPETIRDKPSDVWQFGFLLYHLVFGSKVIDKKQIAILAAELEKNMQGPSQETIALRPGIHHYRDLAYLIIECCLENPQQRPTFVEIISKLLRWEAPDGAKVINPGAALNRLGMNAGESEAVGVDPYA